MNAAPDAPTAAPDPADRGDAEHAAADLQLAVRSIGGAASALMILLQRELSLSLSLGLRALVLAVLAVACALLAVFSAGALLLASVLALGGGWPGALTVLTLVLAGAGWLGFAQARAWLRQCSLPATRRELASLMNTGGDSA
ncbi:hypothetical protein [Aquimonas sp.]|jgi:hypothetical protein|uniref:hypothetical protein n=1 Tax=Aquimonas sp. TaxID=1872588 RepID=UPI0037C13C02